MKKIVFIILLLALSGAAVWYVAKVRQQQAGAAAAAAKTLLLSGNVEVTEINAGFKTPGRVIRMAVEEGATVEAGQELAALDSVTQKARVTQWEAQVAEALTHYDELRSGSRPQEIDQARADVALAQADLAKERKNFDRASILFNNGAIAADAMEGAARARDAAAARHERSRSTLSLIRAGPRQETVKQAQDRVGQAQAALKEAQAALSDMVLLCPSKGVILKKIAEPGDVVAAGIAVYTIGLMDSPYVKIYVKEDKIGLVTLGMKASISVDSYPGKTFEGRVTSISSQAEFTPRTVQTFEERVKLVFAVKVSFENKEGKLKPGMPADVTLYW